MPNIWWNVRVRWAASEKSEAWAAPAMLDSRPMASIARVSLRHSMKGSHPINGGYMTYRYPNWAAKFFMDGLMLEQNLDRISNIG